MSKLVSHTKYYKRETKAQMFPCILQSTTTDALWLFTKPHIATCVSGIELGDVKNNAALSCYKSFKGEVILTQE